METSSLDTTAIKAVYNPQPLEPHEQFGIGEVYQFGPTRVELYSGTDKTPPIVRIRIPGVTAQTFAYVSVIKPSQDGGMLIECVKEGQKLQSNISISKSGSVASICDPPPKPMHLNENGMTENIRGKKYTQTTIDTEGSPEGVRVQIQGIVDAAPRLLDAKNQRSPLVFFLIEDNPKQPDKPVYHEVWAINRAKAELKALKLVKGSVIEAILYRHTYEVELASHEKMMVIRHNLVKVI